MQELLLLCRCGRHVEHSRVAGAVRLLLVVQRVVHHVHVCRGRNCRVLVVVHAGRRVVVRAGRPNAAHLRAGRLLLLVVLVVRLMVLLRLNAH